MQHSSARRPEHKHCHPHDSRQSQDEPARFPDEPDGGEIEEESARCVEGDREDPDIRYMSKRGEAATI